MAQSADGFIDKVRSDNEVVPNWITGKAERVLVHKWRASEQAILVGAGTVRADNPRLNVRDWTGNQPLRLILSSSGSVQLNTELSSNETIGTVIVFTSNVNASPSKTKKINLNENVSSSVQITDYLFNSGIQSLFIEGGTKVIDHFMATNMWDEARIFTGSEYFIDGVKAPIQRGELISNELLSSSSLNIYLNRS